VKTRNEPLEPALAFLRELWALDHALVSTSKRMHDRMGITAEQRMVLRFVGKYPGMTAGELASLLHLEKSTLSFALKRLEEKGLVDRARDPTDARKIRIALTKNGKKLDRPTVGTVERAVERALRATRPQEVDAIRLFLQRLAIYLEDASQ
jgi:MarR family transcriptional regulator, organic hydroperoxide resistance regulator